MNAIQKAIKDIRNHIPREILERTFMTQNISAFGGRHSFQPLSLDQRIREAVIDAQVLPDCHLVGGTEVTVPLQNVQPEYINSYNLVYHVPKHLTQQRSIIRVLHITFGDGGIAGSMNLGLQGSSALLDKAQGLIQSRMPIPIVSTANIELIGENVVLVRENIAMPGNPYLRCVIATDSELNHLLPAAVLAFGKLCVLACKAYIYNSLAISMDQAQLSGGMALGRFREIVDSYSDAMEQYDTMFEERWRKIALLADPTAHLRHLKMITGGRN